MKRKTRISTVTGKEVSVHAAHRKHIKENRGGRDDRPAGTPGATPILFSRAVELGFTKLPKVRAARVWPDSCECNARERASCHQRVIGECKPTTPRKQKYPLGKPLVVHMTEGQIKATRDHEWHRTSGLIYIHPCDFTIGKQVWWRRKGHVNWGIVTRVFDDMLKPARVRHNGRNYTPSVYDYCDKNGDKPCVCDLPIGQRTECQHKPGCPIPAIDESMRGVKLMQSHSPAALAGVFHSSNPVPDMVIAGSMMGPDEYATPGRSATLADYCVRADRRGDGTYGIYLRKFNVCLATFAPNSATLRHHLGEMFADALHIENMKQEKERVSKLSIPAQIRHRQKQERERFKGWYTHGCGQWVHDKDAPCSVCPKPRKKK